MRRFILLLLTTVIDPVSAAPEPPPLTNCFLDRIASPARCGSLSVPLDHAEPGGERIDLRFAILPAVEKPAQPDPLVILAGGPGQSAVGMAALVDRTMREVNQDRDIVLLDQRGTGASAPLACDLDFDLLGFDDQAKDAAIAHCIDELPFDVRHFTTLAHIDDLEALRQALGYAQFNLYGGSYGTRAALVYLREHPASIRTAVLDAVAPLSMRIGLEMGADAQLALDRFFADCDADAACAAAWPRLRERFRDLLAALATEPVTVAYPSPATGELLEDEIDHRMVALAVRALLYSPQTRRALPPALGHAADGDFVPLLGLATAANQDLLEVMTPGLTLAVLCAEDLAGLGQADIPERERQSFVGTAQIDEFLGYCRSWPAPERPADWQPPTADVPVLLLSGALDPVTPPARAEAAAATLPNSRHIVVPAGGHTVAGVPCVGGLIAEFVASADPAAPDAACVAETTAPSFFTSLLGPANGSDAP